jgi:hypothetical protein
MVRYSGEAATAAPAAWALLSGADRTTLELGDGGAGVGMLEMVAVSWMAPVSITRTSPTARPVMLVRRIAVAPAADGWARVVFVTTPMETLPDVSMAR